MKKLQTEINEFCIQNSLEAPISHRVLDLMSELGEFSKEILKASNYGKQEPKNNDELESELGDVLYSLITVANFFDIDLENACKKVLTKYKKRLDETNTIGSGR